MVGWLAGWLAGWLVGWLVGRPDWVRPGRRATCLEREM